MHRFIIQRNIRRYQRLLESEADETRRRTILGLLAEEEGKLADLPDPQHDVGSHVQQPD